MKRLMVMGLTALGLVLAMQQQASAWSKFKFGIGFNISWEGANNCFLFGLLKGGPAPGQAVDGSVANMAGGFASGNPDPNMPPGAPPPYSPGITGDGLNIPPIPAASGQPAPMPMQTPSQPTSAQPVGYFAGYPQNPSPYQPVSYNPYGNPYSGQGGRQGYAEPGNQGGQGASYWNPATMQAPSYWYER